MCLQKKMGLHIVVERPCGVGALMQYLPHSCTVSFSYVGCVAQHPTWCLTFFFLSCPISSFCFFFFIIILVWFLYYCLEAFSSSDFFKFGICGCLVSIGSNLAQFGVMVAKISRLEERWHSVGNSATLFLKNSFISQFVIYIVKPFIWEVVETS